MKNPKYINITPATKEFLNKLCCNWKYYNTELNWVRDYGGYGNDDYRKSIHTYQCSLCKNFKIEISDDCNDGFFDILIVDDCNKIKCDFINWTHLKTVKYVGELRDFSNICFKQGFQLSESFKNSSVWDIINDGLHTNGAHHKQWYLEQIALKLGININNEYLVQLRNEEYGEWDKGVAP